MCGIVGFSGPEQPRLLEAMCDTIVHRGPDSSGYHAGQDMNLAMRRLAIVDLEGGEQPVYNETRDVVTVFNGELYNHLDVRETLTQSGHRFSTSHSDTEVIVHGYEEWGDAWVERVNGMFGLAVWDVSRRRLLLYRDRLGKKPLYYSLVGKEIVFGSEIKALLKHPMVSRELDRVSLGHYFALKNVAAPRTAYADVRQLMPGQMLIWEDGAASLRNWWEADFATRLDITPDEAASHIRALLEDAVRLRMQCDAPFGAYLSGGVDSSAVATLMSRFHDRPVKTFCLGYEDDDFGQFAGKAQDIHHAREMAARIGSDHHEFIINADMFAQRMPEILQSFDEPFSGTISTFFLSILMQEHVKVALSGDGADELFASYLTHRLSFPMEHYLSLGRDKAFDDLDPASLRSIRPFDTREQYAFLARMADTRLSAWRDKLSVFTTGERQRLLASEYFTEAEAFANPYARFDQGLTAQDALNRTLETDQAELLPNQILPFVDRLSMAHSIEVRCPFLDSRLVEFVNTLPGDFKIRGAVNKYILKQAVADLLPQELINRPKEGFVQPIYSWMHGSLKAWTRGKLAALPAELFDARYVEEIAAAFDSGRQEYNAKVWNLACFSIWWEAVR